MGQIAECSEKIRQGLSGWESRIDPEDKPLGPAAKPIQVDGLTRYEANSLREQCYRILGVDLTGVDGINGKGVPHVRQRPAEKRIGTGRVLSPPPR
jgi:hypothetical protein